MSIPVFISEIAFSEGDSGGYLEITVLNSENLSDYTVGFYDENGSLKTIAASFSGRKAGSSFFPDENEITLQDIFDETGGIGSAVCIIGGLPLSVVAHPNNPDYLIFTIPMSLTSGGTNSVETVTVYNTSTNELADAYRAGNNGTVTLQNGAASVDVAVWSGTSTSADSRYNSEGKFSGGGDDIGRTINRSEIVNPIEPPIDPIICFTSWSIFQTIDGVKHAHQLQIGDLIETLDNGYQPIRFIYTREVSASGPNRPVIFAKGSISNTSQMAASQRHQLHTKTIPGFPEDDSDHLIKAQELINRQQMRFDHEVETVTYYHVMFDNHELIKVDGTFSKSWQPHKRNLGRDASFVRNC